MLARSVPLALPVWVLPEVQICTGIASGTRRLHRFWISVTMHCNVEKLLWIDMRNLGSLNNIATPDQCADYRTEKGSVH